MANYLERVASSAGRRAAIAKPPSSGPPLLPANKDFSLPAEGSLPADDDQFLEASTPDRRERYESPRPEERSAIAPTSKVDSRTRELRDDLPARVEPEPKPAASQESLSSEPPFTVYVPKTLRPVTAAKVPPSVADEQPDDLTPTPASVSDPTEFTVAERLVQSRDSGVKESATYEVETDRPSVRTKATVAGPSDERKQPMVRSIKTEAATSETQPVPRVDRDDGPNKIPLPSTSHRDEPLAAVSPVHVPPVLVGSPVRQEQSRISIGSLEVMVNNHPPVDHVRPPAPAPSRSEKVNLEKRYLDRFRLRH